MELTPARRHVLEYLDTDEGEGDLVASGREWWYGTHRTSGALGYSLLRLGLITQSWGDEYTRYYRITDEGRHVLRDPNYIPATLRHLRGEEGPFFIPRVEDAPNPT